ncbi:hypothetical protein ACFX2A_042758 [Malus domestica]
MPNLYSHSRKHSNKIACSKIEEALPSESREPNSQHDYFLKNRREDIALRISRARPPAGLLSQKLKRHRSPNLESRIPDRITCSKTEEAPLSQLQELDLLG